MCLTETRIAEYLDGRLTPEERVPVEAHLNECELCLHEVAELGRVLDPTVPPEAPPRDLEQNAKNLLVPSWPSARRLRWAAAASIMITAAVVLFFYQKSPHQKNAPKRITDARNTPDRSALDYLFAGQASIRTCNFQEAVEDFDRAIRLDPGMADAYVERASAKKMMGDDEGAKADMAEAIRLEPLYMRLPEDLRELPSPSAFVSTAGLSDPERKAEIYNRLGHAKFNLGRYGEAVQYLTRAIELNPESAYAYNDRGAAKILMGDYPGAVHDCGQAIQIHSHYAAAYLNRAAARAYLGDYPGALADSDKAIQINPRLAAAYLNRGAARTHLGDHQQAIADCDEAIRISPRYADAYLNRGNIKYMIRDYAGAVADWETSVKLKPDLKATLDPLIHQAREKTIK